MPLYHTGKTSCVHVRGMGSNLAHPMTAACPQKQKKMKQKVTLSDAGDLREKGGAVL